MSALADSGIIMLGATVPKTIRKAKNPFKVFILFSSLFIPPSLFLLNY